MTRSYGARGKIKDCTPTTYDFDYDGEGEAHQRRTRPFEAEAQRSRIVVEKSDWSEMPLPESWSRMANGEPMPNIASAVRRSRSDR